MNTTTTEPTTDEQEFNNESPAPAFRTTDKRVVNLTDESREPLTDEMATEIALSIGVTRQRVEELWSDGRLTRKGLDWSIATDLAVKRGTSVAEIDQQIAALLGGESKDLSESIRLQREADALADQAAVRRGAAIQKRQQHVQLCANVEKAREELQSVADNEAGISGLITELKDVVSRMARGLDIIPRRAQWPPSELSGALALQKELPGIKKAAEAAVVKATKSLNDFEAEHGINTQTPQEAA